MIQGPRLFEKASLRLKGAVSKLSVFTLGQTR
jgi:hypothetical protein